MRLIQTNLYGFRQLVNRTFDFAPGLNLIFGPNEAGKSSLMEALTILLYGFFGEGRISAADRALLEQLMPWSSQEALGGSLRYQLDTGDAYQVERLFAPYQSVKVIRLSDGRDITKQFRSESEGRLYVAEDHLGIRKDVFENLCRVRQSELALLEQSAKPISETIMRLSASMGVEGLTVPKALESLESTYREKVGTPRMSAKPFVRTKKQIDSLEQEIERTRRMRQAAWELVVSVQTHDEQHGEEELAQLDVLMKKAQLADVTAKLQQQQRWEQEAQELQAQADELSEWASFRHDLYEDLVSLTTQVKALKAEVAAEPQITQESLEALEKERERLLTERSAIAHITQDVVEKYQKKRAIFLDAERNVEAAQLHLENARAEVEKTRAALDALESDRPLYELGQSGVAKLQQQYETARSNNEQALHKFQAAEAEWKRANMEEAAFLALKDTPPSTPPKKGCRLIGRKGSDPNGVPTELVIYNDLLPIYTRWKETQTELEEARRAVETLETTIRRSLLLNDDRVGNETFASAEQRIERYTSAVAAYEAASRTLERAEQTLAEAQERQKRTHAEMVAVLPDGVSNEAELETHQKRLDDLERRLTEIDKQISQAKTELSRWQDKQDAYQQALARLHNLYQEAGIDMGLTLDEMMQQYRHGREQYESWKKVSAEARAALERVKEHEADVEQLQARLQTLQRQLEFLLDEHPEFADLEPSQTAEQYQQQINETKERIQQRKLDQHVRQRDARDAADNMPDLASLLEKRAAAEKRLASLSWFGEALQAAQVELRQAATDYQRQFAPRLQSLLDEGLNHATGGRYSKSEIDPETLTVRLLSPETKEWISANQLSTGTRDLVYLLLRFSIARLMSDSGERLPMLLDDPFVHCDRMRKANILDYLARQSKDMQFLLFTQDDWTRDWLLSQYPDCNVIMMLPQNAPVIDYDRVRTLASQSREIRERLQVAEEEEEILSPPVPGVQKVEKPMPSSPSVPTFVRDTPPAFNTNRIDVMESVLADDETAIRLIRLLQRNAWELEEAKANDLDILQGEFLNLVLDRLNERALDVLGDQLVYTDNGKFIVTEEFRDVLQELLGMDL
ncbi:MAG: SMC family ATPase [Chloroflexota bacterium]